MPYDVFISYRRLTGKDYARIIKPELEKRHLNVFLDLDELKDGAFDKRILDAIESTPVFMIILSPGMLDRCVNEDDWVRQEILYANKCNKHIVPVVVDDSFQSIPDFVPMEIKEVVGREQFSAINTGMLLQVSIEKMIKERILPFLEGANWYETGTGAEIHVETDITCKVYRYSQYLGEAKKGVDNVFRLNKGTQKLVFQSAKYDEAVTERIINIPDDAYTDYVKVDMALMEKNIDRKKQEEQERIRREKERQLSEAERIRQKQLAQQQAAAARERLEREKREREERERRRNAQLDARTVTIVPARWPGWLVYTLLVIFLACATLIGMELIGFVERPIDLTSSVRWWSFVLASIPFSMLGYLFMHRLERDDFAESDRTVKYCNDNWYMDTFYQLYRCKNDTYKEHLIVGIFLFCLLIGLVASGIVSVGFYFLWGIITKTWVKFVVCMAFELVSMSISAGLWPILLDNN